MNRRWQVTCLHRVRHCHTQEGDYVKRRLLMVAVFLLAGAVVNVAVAWGLAVCLNLDGAESTGLQAHETYWRWGIIRQYKPGLDFVHSYSNDSEPVEGLSHPLLPRYWLGMKHRTSDVRPYFIGVGWGWPCKAMWYDYLSVRLSSGTIKNAIPLSTKIALFRTQGGSVISLSRGLPLGVIAGGFLINTLFYAAILWLLISGRFILRRLIRRRRGLCPKCAYPVGESAVCTECGKELAT